MNNCIICGRINEVCKVKFKIKNNKIKAILDVFIDKFKCRFIDEDIDIFLVITIFFMEV